MTKSRSSDHGINSDSGDSSRHQVSDRWRFIRLEDRRLLSTAVGWDGTALLIEDSTGTQSDDLSLSVSDDGQSLVIRDDQNVLTTGIIGADQVSQHEVHLDFSLFAAAGVDAIRIETSGQTDQIQIDLRQHANTFLEKFRAIEIDAGDEAGDQLSLVGGTALQADVELQIGVGEPVSQILIQSTGVSPTVDTQISFSSHADGNSIDLSAFDQVTISTDGGNDELELSAGTDSRSNTFAAITLSGTSDSESLATLNLFDIGRVSLDTSSVDGDDTLVLNEIGNAHRVDELELKTGTGTDQIHVTGEVVVRDSIELRSHQILIDGALTSFGGVVELDASGSIVLQADVVSREGSISISAVDDITQDALTQISTDAIAGRPGTGGSIAIESTDGDIQLLGVVSATGANKGDGVGTDGGSITVMAQGGDLTVAMVNVNGGIAVGAEGRDGGNAGTIFLRASLSDQGELKLLGAVQAQGGLATPNGIAGSGGRIDLEAGADLVAGFAGTEVQAADLRVQAGGNVGATADRLHVEVIRLDVMADQGSVWIEDLAGGLRIEDLDADQIGLAAVQGEIAAHSPLIIAANANLTGSFNFIAGNSGFAGDDITIDNGAIVSLVQIGAAHSLLFQAGDDVEIVDGSIVTSGNNHLVKMVADSENDLGVTDGDGGRIVQTVANATVIDTVNLTLQASRGIGTAARVLTFDATTLTSISSANDGDQYLADVGADLAVQQINAGNGLVALSVVGNLLDPTAVDGTANITAGSAALTALGNVGGGVGGDLDLNVGQIAIDAQGLVDISDVDDLTIDLVNGVDGITSGTPGAGGPITVIAGGALVVARQVSSATGSGGDLTLDGVDVQAAITAGAGNVFLQGTSPDLLIGGALSTSGDLLLSADRDVIVSAQVDALGAGKTLTIIADQDADQVGGMQLKATGQLSADGDITVRGSDLFVTAGPVDSIEIQNDGANDQIVTSGKVLLQANAVAPAAADLIVRGRVTSTSNGDLEFDAADQVILGTTLTTAGGNVMIADAAQLIGGTTILSGAGDVTFTNTLDGAQSLLITSGGTTQFVGAVGNTTALSSLTINGAGATQVDGGLVATSGDQTYGQAVTLGADTLVSTLGGDVFFQGTVDSSGGARDLTLSAGVDDVAFSDTVTLDRLVQLGGTGRTTLRGGTLQGNLQLTTNEIEFTAATLTSNLAGGSGITINAANEVLIDASLDATAGKIVIDANSDNVGAQSLVMSSGTSLVTTSNASDAIELTVLGTGEAQLAAVSAGAVSGGIAVQAGGAISDTNGAAVNLSAFQVSLVSANSVGQGNALETSLSRVAVAAAGEVDLLESDDLTIDLVNGIDGITSGTPGAGGPITVIAGGALVVARQVSSATGSGGDLTLDGVDVQAAITAGAGNIFLQGPSPDLLIGGALSTSGDLLLSADRDVIVSAQVDALGAGKTLTIIADQDADQVGGMQHKAAGQLSADGDITVRGSDLFVTAGPVDSIEIQSDGANDQIVTSGKVLLQANAVAPAAADVIVQGRVTSTSNGDLEFDAADQVILGTTLTTAGGNVMIADAAQLIGGTTILSGAGDVTFTSTLDGAQSLLITSGGTTQFVGAVGNTTALSSLTINGAGATQIDGGLVATSGDQTFGQAVTLGADTLVSTTGGDVFFQGTVDSSGGARDLTLSAGVDDVDFSDTVTLDRLVQLGGTGRTTLRGGTLQGDLDLTTNEIEFTAATLTSNLGGGSGMVLNAANEVLIDASLDATAGKIVIDANSDGVGAESLVMSSGTSIATTSNASDAIELTVLATGEAQLAAVSAGALSGGIAVQAGGAISDTNGAAVNLTAFQASLVAATSVGQGNALETSLSRVAVAAAGEVDLLESDDLTIDLVNGVDGITSGTPGAGGPITVIAGGALVVARQVSSATGSGGDLTLDGVDVQAAITAGAGDVFLQGTSPDLLIGGALSTSGDLLLSADRDVIVSAQVDALGAGKTLTIIADQDADQIGGMQLKATGQLSADGDITVRGSDLFVTAGPVDSIEIQSDGANDQIVTSGKVLLQANVVAPAAADVIVQGRVTSTSNGDLEFDAADQVILGTTLTTAGGNVMIADAAQLIGSTTILSGAGDVTFTNTLDGAQSLLITSGGTTQFVGAVGNTTALSSLTINGAGATQVDGGLVATSGDQTYGQAVTLGADTLVSTTGGDVFFQGAVDSSGGARDLTLSAGVDDVDFSDTVTLDRLVQLGGTGRTTLRGGTLQGDLQITTDEIEFTAATLTTNLAGGSGITLNAANEVLIGASLDATAGKIVIDANTDNAGAQSLVMSSGTSIVTTSNAPDAIEISVAGLGNAVLSVLSVDQVSGGMTVSAGGQIVDGNGNTNNLLGAEAALSAGSGIGQGNAIETELTRLAAATDSGEVRITEFDDLTITNVGVLSGVATASGSGVIELIAGQSIEVLSPITHQGSGAIRLISDDISLNSNNADLFAALGPIVVDAGSGEFVTVAGASVVATQSIRIASDQIDLAASSRIAATSATGTIVFGTNTAGVGMGLGDSAAGAWHLTTAEASAIEAANVRVGSVAGDPFDVTTSGAIDVRDFTTDALFATNLLELRTTSTVTGGSDIDLSAGGTDLVIRSGAAIDLTQGAGDRDLGIVAATTGGANAGVRLDDTINGLTIGTVDGVAGVSTGAGTVRISAKGVNSDVRITADISHSGSDPMIISADDSISVSSGVELSGSGSGDVQLLANRDNQVGNGQPGLGIARDTVRLADGSEISAGSGRIVIRTDSASHVGGDVLVSRLVTTDTGTDAILIVSDGRILDVSQDAAVDLVARQGGVDLTARAGIGSTDTLEIDTQRLSLINNGLGGNGAVDVLAVDDLQIDRLFQGADSAKVQVEGDLTIAGEIESGESLTLLVDNRVIDSHSATSLDLIAPALVVENGSGIGVSNAIEVRSNDLTAEVSGAGDLRLNNAAISTTIVRTLQTQQGSIEYVQTGAMSSTVQQATALVGDIALQNDSLLTLQNVVASGASNSVDVRTVGSGNVRIDRVVAGSRIDIHAAEAISEFASDGGTDLSADRVQLSARDGIGAAGRLEVDAPRVIAEVRGSGDLRLESVTGALTVINAEIENVGDIELRTSTNALRLQNVVSGNGDIEASVTGDDLFVELVTAGGSGDVRLSTADQGSVWVDRVTAVGDRIRIEAAERVVELNVDSENDLSSAELVIAAKRGIGADNRLETSAAQLELHGGVGSVLVTNQGASELVDLDASLGAASTAASVVGGELSLRNNGSLGVTDAVVHGGGGAIELKIVDTGSMEIEAPVLNFGGDVRMLAGSANSDLLVIRDSLPNHQIEVLAAGGGRVLGTAGGDVRFEAPSGSHVLVATDTGSATAVRPQIQVVAVDQGGSNVNSLGNALIDVTIGSVAGAHLKNFWLQLDWHDLVNPVDSFPHPGNLIANPAGRFDLGLHRFFHNFPQGNPDLENPANDIPFGIEVRYDPRLDRFGETYYGIEFYVGSTNVSVQRIDLLLTVPGEGLFGGIVVPPAEIDRIPELPAVPVYLAPVSAPAASGESDLVVSLTALEEDSKQEGARLFYRVVGVDGTDGAEEYELPIEFLEEGKLFDFFKQLPNSRYNVYFKESGADDLRTLFQLNVNEHRLVPIEFAEGLESQEQGSVNPATQEDAIDLTVPADDAQKPRSEDGVGFKPAAPGKSFEVQTVSSIEEDGIAEIEGTSTPLQLEGDSLAVAMENAIQSESNLAALLIDSSQQRNNDSMMPIVGAVLTGASLTAIRLQISRRRRVERKTDSEEQRVDVDSGERMGIQQRSAEEQHLFGQEILGSSRVTKMVDRLRRRFDKVDHSQIRATEFEQ